MGIAAVPMEFLRRRLEEGGGWEMEAESSTMVDWMLKRRGLMVVVVVVGRFSDTRSPPDRPSWIIPYPVDVFLAVVPMNRMAFSPLASLLRRLAFCCYSSALQHDLRLLDYMVNVLIRCGFSFLMYTHRYMSSTLLNLLLSHFCLRIFNLSPL